MGSWEYFWTALGISHPEEREQEGSDVFFSIKELKESSWLFYSRSNIPIIIFPEGTKTNGVGVLRVDEGMIQLIQ
jgi:hypothetical protein